MSFLEELELLRLAIVSLLVLIVIYAFNVARERERARQAVDELNVCLSMLTPRQRNDR